MKRPLTSNEIDPIIKQTVKQKTPNKVQGQMTLHFTDEFYQTFKGNTYLPQILLECCRKGMLLNSFHEVNMNLIKKKKQKKKK